MGIQCHHLLPIFFAVSIYCDLYIAPNFRPHITYGSLFDPQKKKKKKKKVLSHQNWSILYFIDVMYLIFLYFIYFIKKYIYKIVVGEI